MTSPTTDRRLGLSGGAAIKVPCRAATTSNITLSGEQTVDGVSCVTGDRVLVKSQTSSVDNGIYVCDSGTWTRDLDFDGPNDVTTGTIVMVLNGSANSNTYWRLTTAGTIAFGSSALTFSAALAGDSTTLTFLQSGTGATSRTVQAKLRELGKSPEDFGAIGDGTTHALSTVYATLAAAQIVYPHATALTQQIDWAACQAWVNSVPISAGATDPGWVLRPSPGKKYYWSDKITLGNRRIAIIGNGMTGSGSASIFFQSDATKDFFDAFTGSSDVFSLYGVQLLGAGKGTGIGNGVRLGNSGQTQFDSQIKDCWFTAIPNACIYADFVADLTVANNGIENAVYGIYIPNAGIGSGDINKIQGNTFYSLTNGVFAAGGQNLQITGNQFNLCGTNPGGVGDDTTGAIVLSKSGAPSVRETLIAMNSFRANTSDVVISGNNGTYAANSGVNGVSVTANYSDRPYRRFLQVDGANGVACVGNKIIDASQETSNTYDAINVTGTSDRFSASGNDIQTISGTSHRYAIALGVSVTNVAIGVQARAEGKTGPITVTTGARLTVSPGNRQFERLVSRLTDDFLGDVLADQWNGRVGTDPQCITPTITSALGGAVRLVTGDDVAADMATNGVQLDHALNWQANSGLLVFEIRVKLSAITNVALFIGLTDQVSALEMPFTLAAGDVLTSNASNAVGILFDTAADTDNWWMVGVSNDADATKQNSAVAPTAATYETWRIEFLNNTACQFFRNGALIGATMQSAVNQVPLTPVVAAFSRTTASRNIDADYVVVETMRP